MSRLKGWLGGERLGGYPPELAWWTGCQGGGARARVGGKGFGSGGVGGSNVQKEEKWRCGVGGGSHRSWPGGRGGRPRALVAGEGWAGRRDDGSSKRKGRVGAWLAVAKRSKSREGVREGLAWGCKGFGCGGVGGRGTGPRDGANFATCVVFLF